MSWDPQQYDKFEAPRWRPALDLLNALPSDLTPRRVVELGCGGGKLSRLLADRFAQAEVTGIDGSADMLTQAAAKPSRVRWVEADMAGWQPEESVDLIISNAALHWLPNHADLFKHLIGALTPGGVLAVQMPRNFAAASHAIPRDIAGDPRWADRLAGSLVAVVPVHEPAAYYDWLAPRTTGLDIWETEYLQVLDGENAVLEWLKGTTLRPVMAALSEAELADFMAAAAPRLAQVYPRRADGHTLFPFRRLFLIARK